MKPLISRETIDLPHQVVRRRRRMTKKQKAQYQAKRSACGTATTAASAAGIKGRRRPKGTIVKAGAFGYQPQLEATITAMTPTNLPEPYRYRIG